MAATAGYPEAVSEERFRRAVGAQLSLAAERYGADLALPCRTAVSAEQRSAEQRSAEQDAADTLAALASQVATCSKCKLHAGRKNVVFGEGSAQARVMFIGEAPGAREDEQGRPFVGPAGQLLTSIIEKGMGIPRPDTFIVNVNKCRPPGNRDPEPDEVAACLPYLRKQVELIAPRVIVAMGRVAAQNLLSRTERSAGCAVDSSNTWASPWWSPGTRPTYCATRRPSGTPGKTSSGL